MKDENNVTFEINDKVNSDGTIVSPTDQDNNSRNEEHHSHHHHSYHSHHRHHRHHSHHRHHRKQQKHSKKLIIIAICIALVFTLLLAMSKDIFVSDFDNSSDYGIGGSSDELIIEIKNENAVLITDSVQKYLSIDMLAEHNKSVVLGDFLENGERLDAQVPVALKLSTKDSNAVAYKIEISDNELFENAKTDYLDMSSGTYSFEHLYSNTEYFYRVTAYTTSGVFSSTGKFKTADTPRILSIDGISNVRDIGNWKTDSGKRIKQGLLIRGTTLDGVSESSYHLTNDGLADMLEQFGIKTEMDLRLQPSLNKDALGSRVEHKYYNMAMYSEIFNEDGKEKIRAVFTDLANPDNYPIYLHCTYGRDRTGTVCYLLEGLLGVSRGDCLKEYGLSNTSVEKIIQVEKGLESYKGDSLKERTEAYLLSCGISQTQIESIRNIFLED